MGLCENPLKGVAPFPSPRSRCIYSLLIAAPLTLHLLHAEQPGRSLQTCSAGEGHAGADARALLPVLGLARRTLPVVCRVLPLMCSLTRGLVGRLPRAWAGLSGA